MINIYISTDPYTHLAKAWTSMLQWLPLEAALEFKIEGCIFLLHKRGYTIFHENYSQVGLGGKLNDKIVSKELVRILRFRHFTL